MTSLILPPKILSEELKYYSLLNCHLANEPQDVKAHYVQLEQKLLSTTDAILMKYRSILQTQHFDEVSFT